MSGDQLDLDDLLRLAECGFTLKDSEVARIAAEVRRLRALVDDEESGGSYEEFRIKFPGAGDPPPIVAS